jgi:hypothetical protein
MRSAMLGINRVKRVVDAREAVLHANDGAERPPLETGSSCV